MSLFYTSVDRHGNNILFRGYKNGKQVKKKIEYYPTFYVPSKEDVGLKTLEGHNVIPINPGTMRDCRQWLEENKDVGGRRVYGTTNYVHQFISDAFLEDCPWDYSLINVTSIDIEVQSDQGFPEPGEARFPITAIALRSSTDKIYYCWGLGEFDKSNTINTDLHIEYVQCQDEKELLKRFCAHWQRIQPDVLTGWNSRLFDTVYLINRITNTIGESYAKLLSPWAILKPSSIEISGRELPVYDIVGVQQLDYLDLFKKFGYKYGTQESYKLDAIANVVLGKKKIDYSEYASLFDLYKYDHQKFIDYNIRDTALVDQLEDKLGLISLCMTISYKGLVNMSEAFGPVNLWDALIYNELKRNNIVVPPKEMKTKTRQIEGAYVKVPINGMHKWVVSFDVASLYPHIIMQYNMSPETIVNNTYPTRVYVDQLLRQPELHIPDGHCMTAIGQYFKTDTKGFFPKLVQNLYNERNVVKKEMLKYEQEAEEALGETKKNLEKEVVKRYNQEQAIKILMNSLYGAMSNEFFRYYDMRIAESITVTGQLTIRWAEKRINEFLNKILKTEDVDYVIAIDTDSLYINFGPLVHKVFGGDPSVEEGVKFLDSVCKEKIDGILTKGYQELKEYLQAPEQKISMKREVIADKGIWTGKKHYILNVYNREGVQFAEPKLKTMGIEAVRSSTPAVCRKMILDAIEVIIQTDEVRTQQYIQEMKEKFFKLRPEDIAFPRGISNLDKYVDGSDIYRKGTPIHVRGTLLYNYYVKRLKIDTKHPPIYTGEKIKFLYLKVPNRIGENVIAFSSILPEEFGVHDQVDYDTQFDKAVVEPLRTITEAIGWEVEKRATLEDFFV